MSRRLPDTEHTSRPWRIHEITQDFRVEDVWAYRTPGAGPALVKPNGLFGRLYMAAIKPFRYLIVYPALTRQWERAWRNRDRHPGSGVRTTASPARPDSPKSPWSRQGHTTAMSRVVRLRDTDGELR